MIALYILAGLIGTLLGLVLLAHGFCYFFVGKRIKPLVEPYLKSSDRVDYQRTRYLEFRPRQGSPRAGLIFHPGGYADPEAYARIIHKVAEACGLYCVIIPGPQRTPIAKRFSADQVIAANPQIEKWFISGHSQGGAVASLYMRDRLDDPAYREKIAGLIFLGFFVFDRHSLAARKQLPCLSVYGDRDGHAEKFKPNEKNLPPGARVVCIEGGNHGQFGAYRFHFGDQIAEIERETQQDIAINAIVEFVNEHTG